MPNNVYENPLYLAQAYRPLYFFNADCTADLTGVTDGAIVEGVKIVIPGSGTVSNVAATPNAAGRWSLAADANGSILELQIGADAVALLDVAENEAYFEWRGQVVQPNPDAVVQIGFLSTAFPTVLAALTWAGATQQWIASVSNGIDPPAGGPLLAGTALPGTDNRWEIVVGARQTSFKLNGITVASYDVNMTILPSARVRVATLVDASLVTAITDQILIYQAGLVRD
jgi:hypothetical protein